MLPWKHCGNAGKSWARKIVTSFVTGAAKTWVKSTGLNPWMSPYAWKRTWGKRASGHAAFSRAFRLSGNFIFFFIGDSLRHGIRVAGYDNNGQQYYSTIMFSPPKEKTHVSSARSVIRKALCLQTSIFELVCNNRQFNQIIRRGLRL